MSRRSALSANSVAAAAFQGGGWGGTLVTAHHTSPLLNRSRE